MKQLKDDAGQPQSYRNKLKALIKALSSTKAKQDLASYGEAKRNCMPLLKDKVLQACICSLCSFAHFCLPDFLFR